jgi:hypothetical protein
MGGSGSGSWYRWQSKKTTVEDSLSLSITNFRGRLTNGTEGTFTWKRGSEVRATINYFVTVEWDEPVITLSYRFGGREDISYRVRTEITSPNFGGQRWWFTCPLFVNGRTCFRRVGKLYLPPGGKYFGCRTCCRLTYRSSQEAHQATRAFVRMGLDPADAALFDKCLRRRYP